MEVLTTALLKKCRKTTFGKGGAKYTFELVPLKSAAKNVSKVQKV
jgi:hypothetical protein